LFVLLLCYSPLNRMPTDPSTILAGTPNLYIRLAIKSIYGIIEGIKNTTTCRDSRMAKSREIR